MKFESFRDQLAIDVAVKAGISGAQADLILSHIASHAEKRSDETLNVMELGTLHLINVPGASWVDEFGTKGTLEFPSQAVARFKLNDSFKEIMFSGFDHAIHTGIKWYEVIDRGHTVQVFCGLEGDPHTDPPDIIIRTEESMGLG